MNRRFAEDLHEISSLIFSIKQYLRMSSARMLNCVLRINQYPCIMSANSEETTILHDAQHFLYFIVRLLTNVGFLHLVRFIYSIMYLLKCGIFRQLPLSKFTLVVSFRHIVFGNKIISELLRNIISAFIIRHHYDSVDIVMS